jgi:hypothetical protein
MRDVVPRLGGRRGRVRRNYLHRSGRTAVETHDGSSLMLGQVNECEISLTCEPIAERDPGRRSRLIVSQSQPVNRKPTEQNGKRCVIDSRAPFRGAWAEIP